MIQQHVESQSVCAEGKFVLIVNIAFENVTFSFCFNGDCLSLQCIWQYKNAKKERVYRKFSHFVPS